MKNIFETLNNNKFSYEEIKNKSNISLVDENEYDINIIVGLTR